MAARFCSQCGHEVSSSAKFCPNCAAPLTPAVSIPPAPSAVTAHPLDAASRKSRSLLLPATIVTILVLAAALAVLAAHSRQQASLLNGSGAPSLTAPAVTNAPLPASETAPPLTNAPNQAPLTGPALTNAPNQTPATGPALTNAPDKPAGTLPPDVAAYLIFLQGIEQKRIAMNNDTSGLLTLMPVAQGLQGQQAGDADSDDPGSGNGQDAQAQGYHKLSQGYADYSLKWQTLIRDFRATPPPPSCTQLASKYLVFLSDYTTLITKLQVLIIKHDPSTAPDFSAVTQTQAEVSSDGAVADTALGDLCSRYGVAKPFVIAPEGAAPSLLGH